MNRGVFFESNTVTMRVSSQDYINAQKYAFAVEGGQDLENLEPISVARHLGMSLVNAAIASNTEVVWADGDMEIMDQDLLTREHEVLSPGELTTYAQDIIGNRVPEHDWLKVQVIQRIGGQAAEDACLIFPIPAN